MCAAKTSSRPTVQRVAKYLYVRGNSYEFRRVIPPHARAAFDGIATFSRSFGDVSRREAEHLAAECSKNCDRLIAGATDSPDPTARVAAFKFVKRVPDKFEIDRAVRDWVLEQERHEMIVPADRGIRKQRVKDFQRVAELTPVHLREDRWGSLLTTQWVAEAIAEANHWHLPLESDLRDYLNDRVGRAQREVSLRIKAELNYEDRPAPTHAMFEPTAFAQDRQEEPVSLRAPVPIMEIFQGYLAERRLTQKTEKKWKRALSSLIEHLGHDDASLVTPADVIAWKAALLTPNDGEVARSAGTVRNGYIGAAKPVFGWAKDNRKIEINPVAGVTVRVPPRVRNRPLKGYTEEEARLVLKAAFATDYRHDASYGAFARRWLPWLCAYTGARVVEMAQLRRSDVNVTSDGIWYVTISPDAGSQKAGQARNVPLHPHLIEQGFPDAVAGRVGPLFYDPTLKQEGSTGNSQAQKAAQRVAEWVRELGVNDPELQPNHGWRHAFITNSRGKIDGETKRAIVGHSSNSEHEAYGDIPLRVMSDALDRFPRYRL